MYQRALLSLIWLFLILLHHSVTVTDEVIVPNNPIKSLWKISKQKKRFVIDEYANTEIDPEAKNLSGQELIDYVNSHQKLWKAGVNKFNSYSDHVKYGLLGVNNMKQSMNDQNNLPPIQHSVSYIPESFDARKNWPECASLKNIRDQSSCGSCWAIAAVEAMSDRICIMSKGKLQVTLSADDLISCCKICGFGCYGGEPMAAWKYWISSGIVTGSNYTNHAGCRPYPFPPCEHHNNKTHYEPCKHDLYPTPKCDRKCDKNYKKSYKADKYYGKQAYHVENDVESIQKEIMTLGPVEASFEVYSDFLQYTGGIYKHVAGSMGGGHAVKLLGWGIDQGVPYWLAANSWNTDWGENGYFRILRGINECGIESGIVAGIPKRSAKSKFYGINEFSTE
ncbi:Cathepsin B-like cysteine proteinase 6 [Acanthocheilonema viteae]